MSKKSPAGGAAKKPAAKPTAAKSKPAAAKTPAFAAKKPAGKAAKPKLKEVTTAPAVAASALAPAQAPPAPVRVHVRYNHYNDVFEAPAGRLAWGAVDEQYCISFVYHGAFGKRLRRVAAGGAEPGAEADLGPDGRWAVEEGEYELIVVEDAAAEEAAAASRPARGVTGAGEGTALRTGPAAGSTASSRLTDELKGLSLDELRGQSDRYKARPPKTCRLHRVARSRRRRAPAIETRPREDPTRVQLRSAQPSRFAGPNGARARAGAEGGARPRGRAVRVGLIVDMPGRRRAAVDAPMPRAVPARGRTRVGA